MLRLFSFPFNAMGSVCELKLYANTEQRAECVAELLVAEVRRFEQKYTRFKSTSVTSDINSRAGKPRGVELDGETGLLIDYAQQLHQQSDGLFDITSGILRQAWDFKSNQLPTDRVIANLLPLIGWEKVIWEKPYFHLPKAGMEIDFGGYVKEYTADALAALCKENEISHGLINLGGDIRVVGSHPDQSPWTVGIQHPRQANQAVAKINIMDGALATSGDYERFMMINSKRYCHLLNPFTGQAIQPQLACVSVVSDSCLLSGSFSSIAMLKSEVDKHWIADIGLSYLTVDQQLQVAGSIVADAAALDSDTMSIV